MKYKALIIGCGNIGALYDFDNDEVLTHMKGLYTSRKFDISIYDPNIKLAEKVANKYQATILSELIDIELKSYDLVCISSPTRFHMSYLQKFLQLNTKVIICEKPISNSISELNTIQNSYTKSTSKVIVNYFRSFQPSYIQLKSDYTSYLTINKLQSIHINYKRGFLNNASHAFNLIEFLFGVPVELTNIKQIHKNYDDFVDDPTISTTANWGKSELFICGLKNTCYTLWEIHLNFSEHRILITEGGNTIKIVSFTKNQNENIFQATNCIQNYMNSVIDYALTLLEYNKSTNFEDSILLNKKMIEYIQ